MRAALSVAAVTGSLLLAATGALALMIRRGVR